MGDEDRMIQELLQRADGQAMGQQMIASAILAAMQNPREIRSLQRSAIGLRKDDDGGVWLMIATEDGVRIDVPLAHDSQIHILQTLTELRGSMGE